MYNIQRKISQEFAKGIAILLFCLPVITGAQVISFPEYRVSTISKLNKADSLWLKKLFDSSEVVRHTSTDNAIAILEQALELSRQKQFAGGISRALIGLAGCYTHQGNYPKARQTLKDALPYTLIGDVPSRKLTTRWYNNVSVLYIKQGDYEQAYRCLDKALIVAQNADSIDYVNIVTLYSNIASLWHKAAEPDKALFYLNKAQEVADKNEMPDFIKIAMYDLFGLSYDRKGKYDIASSYYRKAIGIAKQSGNIDALQNSYISLGNMHSNAGDIDSALLYLKKGIDMGGNDPTNGRMAPYFYLGKVYLQKKNYKYAEHYALASLQFAKMLHASSQKSSTYKLLAVIYSEMGKYKEAAQFLELHMDLKDSLLNSEKQRIISELDVKYRTAEKDKELAIKEHSLYVKNIMIWGILVTVLLLTLFFVNRYRLQQKLQAEKINNLEKDQEIKRLHAIMEGEEHERSRIAHELHDGIISQLTAVKLNFSRLLQQQNPDKAAFEHEFKYLDETMQDLRKTAHNLMPETVVKSGLINSLKDFCRKMDNENVTRIQFITSGELPRIELPMALSIYRMVQELVQNALKHAKARNLLVQLNCHEDLIDITVEDDGIGFNEQKAVQQGTGLYHIRQRVAAMKGHIEFISAGGGATVYTEIPIPSV